MICRSHGIHSLSTIRPDVHRNLLDMMIVDGDDDGGDDDDHDDHDNDD
jgi:hypothetical protein